MNAPLASGPWRQTPATAPLSSRPSPGVLVSSSSSARSGPLGDAPVVRRCGEWWLTTPVLSLRVDDPQFAQDLDRYAADLAHAHHAVAALHSARGGA